MCTPRNGMLKKLKSSASGATSGEEKFVVVKYTTAAAFWFKPKRKKLDVCADAAFVDSTNKSDRSRIAWRVSSPNCVELSVVEPSELVNGGGS